MNIDLTHTAWMVAVMAAVTFLIRAFPFIMFGGGRTPSALVLYLGRVISPAAIAMLVVYCFRLTPVTAAPHGLPELCAGLLVVLLQIALKNPLVSILCGTALYMFMIR